MTIENALTNNLTYGDGIARVWEKSTASYYDDAKTLQTVLEGRVIVDIASEDTTDALQVDQKLTGDLATGVPSIEVTLNSIKHVLTWQEAYNLSEMLAKQVNLALYG